MYSVPQGCPCGYLTDSRNRCRCPSTAVARYLTKISGPLLDRIDLHVDVPAVPFDALTHAPSGETLAHIRARVLKARRWCRRRGQPCANAQLNSKGLKRYCELTPEAGGLLRSATRELALSARSYTKILKISRTIADLAKSDRILRRTAHPPPPRPRQQKPLATNARGAVLIYVRIASGNWLPCPVPHRV